MREYNSIYLDMYCPPTEIHPAPTSQIPSCSKCGKTLKDGIILIRANAKGIPAIWVCKQPGGNDVEDIIHKAQYES